MPNTADALSGSNSWLRMSLALAFVIALVFLSAWLLKKVSAGKLFTGPSLSGEIKVLARVPLGEKRYLMVVAIQETVLLLGVAAHSINLIKELDHFLVQDSPRDSVFEKLLRSVGRQSEGRNA